MILTAIIWTHRRWANRRWRSLRLRQTAPKNRFALDIGLRVPLSGVDQSCRVQCRDLGPNIEILAVHPDRSGTHRICSSMLDIYIIKQFTARVCTLNIFGKIFLTVEMFGWKLNLSLSCFQNLPLFARSYKKIRLMKHACRETNWLFWMLYITNNSLSMSFTNFVSFFHALVYFCEYL